MISYRTQAMEILRFARRPLTTSEIAQIIFTGENRRTDFTSVRNSVCGTLNKAARDGEVIKTILQHPKRSLWALPKDPDYRQMLKAEADALESFGNARNAQWEVLEE